MLGVTGISGADSAWPVEVRVGEPLDEAIDAKLLDNAGHVGAALVATELADMIADWLREHHGRIRSRYDQLLSRSVAGNQTANDIVLTAKKAAPCNPPLALCGSAVPYLLGPEFYQFAIGKLALLTRKDLAALKQRAKDLQLPEPGDIDGRLLLTDFDDGIIRSIYRQMKKALHPLGKWGQA